MSCRQKKLRVPREPVWRIRSGRSCRTGSRGFTLFAALACLAVIMLFAAAASQALMIRHRASRWDEYQLQSQLLVESAVARARARLAADDAYSGETWGVSLDQHGSQRQGVALIRVLSDPGQPRQRRIEVEARWPDDPIVRVQRRKQVTITLSQVGAES